jgi:hypothetical protein
MSSRCGLQESNCRASWRDWLVNALEAAFANKWREAGGRICKFFRRQIAKPSRQATAESLGKLLVSDENI